MLKRKGREVGKEEGLMAVREEGRAPNTERRKEKGREEKKKEERTLPGSSLTGQQKPHRLGRGQSGKVMVRARRKGEAVDLTGETVGTEESELFSQSDERFNTLHGALG